MKRFYAFALVAGLALLGPLGPAAAKVEPAVSTGPAAGPGPVAGTVSLVSVENPAPGAAATLLAGDIAVVRDMERYLLVVADSGEQARLTELGFTWKTLDPTIAGKTYYTASRPPAGSEAALGGLVRMLRADEHDIVFEAAPDRAEATAGLGLEIARVFLRPIRPARIDRADAPPLPRAASRLARDVDPLIQAMVASVSSAAIDAQVQRLQDFVTRYAPHDSCDAAAAYIKAEFESYGIDSVYFHPFSPSYADNVVAVIPGKGDPSRTVVIGGHFDSTTGNANNAPGADDDASGTACVLETARVLSGYDFDFTLMFVTFSAEELGLIGSEAFAAEMAAQGKDIVAAVAVDMIGYVAGGDAIDLDIIDNASSMWIRDLAMSAAATYVPELAVVAGALPGGASSDHASFWAHGYDAILFFEDTGNYSPYIHSTNDVVGVSYNSPVLAERSVKAATALLASLANPFRLAIAHAPLPDTEDTANPYRVVADIVTSGTLEPDSLLVRYSTGGPASEVGLTATGNPDEYEAWIPAQPGGTTVSYWLVAANTDGTRTVHPAGAPAETHSFFVGTITALFADDFEVDRGFTVGDVGDDASTGVWVRVDPNGTWSGSTPVQPEDDHTPTGTVCWVTGNASAGSSQGANDVDGGKTTIVSPEFDFFGLPNAHVRYHRWSTNDTGAEPGLDEWRVDASSDGGVTWVNLEATTESDRTWRFVEHDLAGVINFTSYIKFRFVASDEDGGSIVEAGVDDFAVVVYQEPSAVGVEVAWAAGLPVDRLTLAPSAPNPFVGETAIRFAVPAPGHPVTLRIFDVAGREVAKPLDRELVEGARSVVWDGRDGRGRSVPAGVYFFRLEANGEERSSKLLRLR